MARRHHNQSSVSQSCGAHGKRRGFIPKHIRIGNTFDWVEGVVMSCFSKTRSSHLGRSSDEPVFVFVDTRGLYKSVVNWNQHTFCTCRGWDGDRKERNNTEKRGGVEL